MQSIERWVEVEAPTTKVFNLFADLEGFPTWTSFIKRVERLSDKLTRWQAVVPAEGSLVQWETETVAYEPAQRLAWRAVRGAGDTSGEATFEETRRGTTLMRLAINYNAPLGDDDAHSIDNFNKLIEDELESSLNRFKNLAQRRETSAPGATSAAATTTAAAAAVTASTSAATSSSNFVSEKDEQEITLSGAPPLNATQRDRSTLDDKNMHQLGATPPVDPPRRRTAAPPPPSHSSVDTHTPPSRPINAAASTTSDQARTQNPIVIDFNQKQPRPALKRFGQSPLLLALLAVVAVAALFALMRFARQPTVDQADATSPNTATAPDASSQPDVPSPAASSNAASNLAPSTSPEPPVVTVPEVRSQRVPALRAASIEISSPIVERAALQSALADWTNATNNRDLDRQMSFYTPTVQRYYRGRYVSLNAVRDDKRRRFERAGSVQITVGKPTIYFNSKSRTATMRFRKQYVIGTGSQAERGEVVQELIWLKTEDGWKIVGERDVQVVS